MLRSVTPLMHVCKLLYFHVYSRNDLLFPKCEIDICKYCKIGIFGGVSQINKIKQLIKQNEYFQIFQQGLYTVINCTIQYTFKIGRHASHKDKDIKAGSCIHDLHYTLTRSVCYVYLSDKAIRGLFFSCICITSEFFSQIFLDTF